MNVLLLGRSQFHERSAAERKTLEGIGTPAVDKGAASRWDSESIKDVDPGEAGDVFGSPGAEDEHPLEHLV